MRFIFKLILPSTKGASRMSQNEMTISATSIIGVIAVCALAYVGYRFLQFQELQAQPPIKVEVVDPEMRLEQLVYLTGSECITMGQRFVDLDGVELNQLPADFEVPVATEICFDFTNSRITSTPSGQAGSALNQTYLATVQPNVTSNTGDLRSALAAFSAADCAAVTSVLAEIGRDYSSDIQSATGLLTEVSVLSSFSCN